MSTREKFQKKIAEVKKQIADAEFYGTDTARLRGELDGLEEGFAIYKEEVSE